MYGAGSRLSIGLARGRRLRVLEVIRDAFARPVGPPLTRDSEARPVAESLRLA